MAADKAEILSKRQLSEINRALSSVDSSLRECDLAEGCGIDCTQQRTDLDEIRQLAQQFKATYFPGAK